jgi:hypothetical protein
MNTRRLWFHGFIRVLQGSAPRLTAMLATGNDAVKESGPSSTPTPRGRPVTLFS